MENATGHPETNPLHATQASAGGDSTEPSMEARPHGGAKKASPVRRGDWRLVVACTASALFGAVTFAPAIHNAFIYDDWPLIVDNPAVNIHDADGPVVPWYRVWVAPYWPSAPDKLYRPLTTLTLRFNAHLAGAPPEPEAFRAINIILHMLACVAVVILAWRVSGSSGAGAVAGMLFATHPIHTEAVVPIYGRSELLAGCLGAWVLARHARAATAERPRGIGEIVLSSLLLAGAVMSKEHAVFLLPALMVIDIWHRHDPSQHVSRLGRRDWFNRIFGPAQAGFVLACAVFLLFRYAVFGWQTHLPAEYTRIWEVPMAHVGLIEHVLTPFRLLWVFATNLAWPDSLCPIWSYPALRPAEKIAPDVAAGIIACAAMLIVLVVLWRKRFLAGAMLAGLILTLLLPLQVIPAPRWFYAERWFYLPTVFVAVLVGWAVRRWGRAAMVAGLTVSLVLCPQSWQYAAKFADDVTMTREVIVRQPDNFQGRRNYTSVLYHLGRYPEAIQAANQLIERFGPVPDAYVVLIGSHLELGDGRRALEAIDKLEQLESESTLLLQSGRRQEALELLAKQRLRPSQTAPASRGADH